MIASQNGKWISKFTPWPLNNAVNSYCSDVKRWQDGHDNDHEDCIALIESGKAAAKSSSSVRIDEKSTGNCRQKPKFPADSPREFVPPKVLHMLCCTGCFKANMSSV